ncbi:E3 ubiquitin-protein ligase TRIM33-like [Patella vulgata]|uniref:E3 ubiquitin-protein ligase TRIM33-like n=1 Tax=Patella vulgata TaxID=6465 RepID=UPI0024A9C1D0|nr:E3 ubiquitin-protein ligase TRIM33-like [Patella vulgata]
MAEQTDKEVCSICLNDFQEPVIIDCQHSFCFSCLEEYLTKTSTKDQFQCPLCRCLINGGVQQYRPTLNIDDNSVINIPQCHVCSEDTSQYFCQDCDQYLCKSCRAMHDKLKSCKDHVVCRYDENHIGQQPRSSGTKKENTPVTHHKDFCSHHEKKKVTIYCKDCSLAICWKCFVANHNGHNYLDLQDDEVRQNMRQDLRTLNDDLETQVTKLQKHYDNLKSKLIEVKNFTKTECDKVDARVNKICSEFRKIGENIKQEMQKTGEDAESKFEKLMEDIKILTEDLKGSVKYSVNVLEDSSIVEVLQRIPKVRQEKDGSSCRKLDIPDVRYSRFQIAKIDKTLLTRQLGKIVSCHQNMFEDIFNVNGKWRRIYHCKQHVLSGFTWSISVFKNNSLYVTLQLDDVEDESITSCKVDVTFKVINKTDDRHHVVKHCNKTIKPDEVDVYYTNFIDWEKLGNTVSGFIDDDGNFTIQVIINEVTDIERRE